MKTSNHCLSGSILWLLICLTIVAGSCYDNITEIVNCSATSDLPDEIKTPLSFLVIGDWGKGGESGSTKSRRLVDSVFKTESSSTSSNINNNRLLAESSNQGTNQVAVAKAMAQYANETLNKPSFVVSLGDNFYTKGVSSTTDTLWTLLWTDIYLKYESLKSLPWYAVLGNHDYGYGSTGVQAQIDKTFVENSTWNMPEKNYTKRFVKDDISVQIIFIDTTTLAPSENGCCNTKSGISSEMQAERIKNQHARIEAMLNDTLSDPPNWLIVAGHYPVFSSGDHGDTDELLLHLLPLLEMYNVDIYLSGHDHISEHLVYGNTSYYVVGAGCMTDQLKATSAANLLWYGVGYSAFAVMDATQELLTMTFIDTNNEIKYSSSHVKVPPNITNTNAPSLEPSDSNDSDDVNNTATFSPSHWQDNVTTLSPTIIFNSTSTLSPIIKTKQRKSFSEKVMFVAMNNPEVSIGTSCVFFAVLAFFFTKMYYKLKMSSKSNAFGFTSLQPPIIVTSPLLRVDIERGNARSNDEVVYVQDKKRDRNVTPMISNGGGSSKNINNGAVYSKLHTSYITSIRSRWHTNSSAGSVNRCYPVKDNTVLTTNSNAAPMMNIVTSHTEDLGDREDETAANEHVDDIDDHKRIREELLANGFEQVISNVYGNDAIGVHYNTSNSKDRTSDDQDSDGEYMENINDGSFTHTIVSPTQENSSHNISDANSEATSVG